MLWVEGTANAKVLRQYQAWCIWGEVRRPVFWRKVRVRESWSNWNQRRGAGPNHLEGVGACSKCDRKPSLQIPGRGT